MRVLLAFVLLIAAGCTEKLPVEATLPVVPKIAVTPDSVQAIFSLHCSECHGSGDAPLAGMRLYSARASWLALVNIHSNEDPTFFRVAPFDTVDSWLVMKLKNDPRIVGSQMPLGDPPLPQAKVSVIAGWIASGAPADSVPLPALLAEFHQR